MDISEAELSAEISVDFLFCVPTMTGPYPSLLLIPGCGEHRAGIMCIGGLCLAFGVYGTLGTLCRLDCTTGKGFPGCDLGADNEEVVEFLEDLELGPQ